MTQTPAEPPSSADTPGTGSGPTPDGAGGSPTTDGPGGSPTTDGPDGARDAGAGSTPPAAGTSAEGADITAEVLSTEQIRINGTPHAVTEGQNPYLEVYAQAHQHARKTGEPAVVHGIDRVRGEQSWFSMSPEGEVLAHSQPGNGRPAPGPAQTAPRAEPSAAAGPPTAEGLPAAGLPQGPDRTQTPAQTPAAGLDPAAPPTRVERRRIAEAGRPFVSVAAEKPQGGFRRFLYDATFGAINIGPGQKELQERELIERIARPLQGSHNTAVLSLKGGIGKTSTTVGVGMTLAHFRGDIPCAIDANPDSGDLVERALGERAVQAQQPPSITDLLEKLDQVDSLTALQGYLQQAGRLHVLAGEQDPALSDSLTAEEWRRIHAEFAKYYSVVVTDCGTGVTHNAMKGILHTADNIVIAAGFAVSGAQRALQTLNWLANHGYERLARESIVVITDKERVSDRVDKQAIQESLRGYCGKLVVVPFDRAVVDGDRIKLDMLQEETRRAYMTIAAAMVDGYR